MRTTLPVLVVLFLTASPAFAQQGLPITAREHLDDALQAAQGEDPDAQLLAVSADSLDLDDGTSSSWTYLFDGSDADSSLVVLQRSTGARVRGTALAEDVPDRPFALRGFTPSPIPQDWIDGASGWFGSDRALERVEALDAAGNFRSNHDNVTISARLASLPADLVNLGGEEVTAWLVTYAARADNAFQVFAVVADGGNVVSLFNEPRSFAFLKAQTSDFAARQAARDSLETDEVNLTAVASVVPDLNARGETILWRYTFYAPEQDAFLDAYVLYGSVVYTATPRREPLTQEPLPSGWIDSDRAMQAAADTLFREEPGALAQARLTSGLYPDSPDRAAWKIDVVRPQADTSGTAYVDPETGALIEPPTASDRDVPPQAARFTVSGPRPNPFRRAAALRFTLPAPAAVTVTVFDVMGRLVRRRSLGRRPAGAQQVRVQGKGLPAGVYVYRITAKGSGSARVATGKMARVR
jgi:hypothetical protein